MPRQIHEGPEAEIMSRLPEDIEARLNDAAPGGIEFSSATDTHGVTVAWAGLANRDELLGVADLLHGMGARLSIITASQPPVPPEEEQEEEESEGEEGQGSENVAESGPASPPTTFGGTPLDGTSYEIAYHFDVGGDTLTLLVYVPAGGSVASLTPLFRTADWNERELMELYAIAVRDHPDPRRLFIDDSIDPAVFERLIPFSTLVNAASTDSLWKKIMNAKAGGP
jgi:NADH:ubiquinone oxidoreductase subunit C